MRQFWNMTAHRGRDSITPPRHQRPMRGASPRAHRRASVGASPLRRPARTKQRTRRRLSFTQKCAAIGAAVGICARQPLDDATEEVLTPCEPPKPAARPFVPVCTTAEPVQGNELVRFRRLPRFEYDEGNATPNPYAVLNVPRDVRGLVPSAVACIGVLGWACVACSARSCSVTPQSCPARVVL